MAVEIPDKSSHLFIHTLRKYMKATSMLGKKDVLFVNKNSIKKETAKVF